MSQKFKVSLSKKNYELIVCEYGMPTSSWSSKIVECQTSRLNIGHREPGHDHRLSLSRR